MANPDSPDNPANEHNPPSLSPQIQKNTPPGEVQTTIIIIEDNGVGYSLGHDVGFEEQITQNKFICKVYSIILCQLILTIGFLLLAIYYDPFKEYLEIHSFSFKVIGMFTIFGTLFPLACCECSRRIFPINLILFLIFSVGQSFLLAAFISRSYPDHVLFAFYLTALICFILTLFAIFIKIDFTVMGGIISIGSMVFFYACIIYLFFPGNLFKHIVLVTGVIIFTIHLIYDTQLMIGGNHRYSISPDEYLIAAIVIHIDIVFIFVIILNMIGGYFVHK